MRHPVLLAAAFLALAWSAGASAQESGMPRGFSTDPSRAACIADYQRLCSDVPRGGNNILNCLLGHYQQLETRCYTALQSFTNSPQAAEAPAACHEEFLRWCYAEQPGGMRVLSCLSHHTTEMGGLGTKCAQAVTAEFRRRNTKPNPAPSTGPAAPPLPQSAPGYIPPATSAAPNGRH